MIESLGNVTTKRDRRWLIAMAIWSAVLWPVYQHFDNRGNKVETFKVVVDDGDSPDQHGVPEGADDAQPHNEVPQLVQSGDEIRFEFPSDRVATVPRTVNDGPDPVALLRSRLAGVFVRHGNDWVWEQRSTLLSHAEDGTWSLTGERADWRQGEHPLIGED